MNRPNTLLRIFCAWLVLVVVLAIITMMGCSGSSSSDSTSSGPTLAGEQHKSSSASSLPVESLPVDSSPVAGEGFYGLYVAAGRPGENGLLGDPEQEQKFLRFVRDNGFNYLIFYDLFDDTLLAPRAAEVASLIKRAKEEYGVKQVALALGGKKGADAALAYNHSQDDSARIDVLNLEYEFWNEPNRELAFAETLEVLRYFKTIAEKNNLTVETYIGWINEQEGRALSQVLDRVLVHYYRTTDQDAIHYGLERLQYLAAGRTEKDTPLAISPIFSNEGPLNTNDAPFLGSWLETHPHEQAYDTWAAEYAELDDDWKSTLNVEGATWFIYDKFWAVRNPQSHIVEHPQSKSLCVGDTLSLHAASSVTEARYCWMFEGQCLVDGGKVSGAHSADLMLLEVDVQHAGEYFLRVTSYDADNPQTFASQAARVDVNICQ